MVNSGQTCIAPDFILVIGDDALHGRVVAALKDEIVRQYGADV